MRNRWCSYLGQEMEANLQEKLTDFLPKLLDCSTEIKSFHDPPKVPSYSALELFERFNRIMSVMGRVPKKKTWTPQSEKGSLMLLNYIPVELKDGSNIQNSTQRLRHFHAPLSLKSTCYYTTEIQGGLLSISH
ncbi:hypothetical protein WMY93_016860 [Mugilogobius chulae]|uniref:Uncharacterized protein n=1 Tax=Mugilogobius chulae TaxID=88201 RepID=A0AAW0NMS8_9GOBI